MNTPAIDTGLLAPDPTLVKRFRWFSRAAAVAATTVGLVVLLGWALGIGVLKTVGPGLVSMKPNTALGFVLIGLSLGAVAAADASGRRIRIGAVAAALAAAIGLATLLEYVFGWDLGIDQILFRDAAGALEAHPGRMALTTAGCLLALGGALLFAGAGRNRVASLLSALVGLTAFVAMLGYLYRVPALRGIPGYSSMAVHTASIFLAAALGVMLLRPERLAISGRNSGGILLRRLFPAMIVALVALGWLQVEAQRRELADSSFGVSLMVALRMVVLSGLIAWTAASLRKVERGRLAAERALRDLNLALEDRVRMRTEELMASEKRAASIIATSADCFVSIDGGSRITDWNRQAEQTFGWERDEVLGRLLTETIIPERFRTAHEEGISHFLATGESSVIGKRVEMTAVHRDRREFPVELSVWATTEGNALSFNAFVKDISQRKQAEQKLRESEERFRLLAETAPVGIDRRDTRGRCTYVNRAWSAITGLSPEQAIGDGWAVVVHPDEGDRVVSAWAEATADSRDLQQRYRIRTPEGIEKWVDSRAVAIKGDIPSAHGYVGTLIDVSAEVEARRAIAGARDHALDASKSKSEFLATMSHEIRTPMNGVIGLTGLLLDTELNETQRTYAEGVKTSGEALLSIINDILDLSKIEAGKLQLEEVDFNIANAIEQVRALVAESARAKGLKLVVQCNADVPADVRGDVGRLRQILLNLATNAIKFTKTGEVVLRAFLDGEAAAEKVAIQFEVVDTGAGIAEKDRQRLFEPFVQVDSSTTRRYGGTGLGLAICRQLATAMGGTVGVESRIGQGSRFWLRLNLARALAPVESSNGFAATSSPAGAAGGEGSPGRPSAFLGRVLIVEDHPVNQEVATALVARLGYSCNLAENGIEALAALEEESYDAVLMDCYMPEMDGFQATAEVRRREAGRLHTPIIAMTAGARDEDREKCMAAGMDDFLAKPIRNGELETALARWIPAAQAGPPTPAPSN